MAAFYEGTDQFRGFFLMTLTQSYLFFQRTFSTFFSFLKDLQSRVFSKKYTDSSQDLTEVNLGSQPIIERGTSSFQPGKRSSEKNKSGKVISAAERLKEIFDPLVLPDRLDLNLNRPEGAGIDLEYYNVVGPSYFQILMGQTTEFFCSDALLLQAYSEVLEKHDLEDLRQNTSLQERSEITEFLIDTLNGVVFTFTTYDEQDLTVLSNAVGAVYLNMLEQNLPEQVKSGFQSRFQQELLNYIDIDKEVQRDQERGSLIDPFDREEQSTADSMRAEAGPSRETSLTFSHERSRSALFQGSTPYLSEQSVGNEYSQPHSLSFTENGKNLFRRRIKSDEESLHKPSKCFPFWGCSGKKSKFKKK